MIGPVFFVPGRQLVFDWFRLQSDMARTSVRAENYYEFTIRAEGRDIAELLEAAFGLAVRSNLRLHQKEKLHPKAQLPRTTLFYRNDTMMFIGAGMVTAAPA